MHEFDDAKLKADLDRLGRERLQHVVSEALEEGYTHGTITAGLLKQAYSIMRLTLAIDPVGRKEMFLALAAEMADAIEKATRPRAQWVGAISCHLP